jgi:hypothetical protein
MTRPRNGVCGKIKPMEKVVTKIRSFEAADRADKEYYHRLTPLERLEILLELNRRWPSTDAPTSDRLQRVCRIIKRASGYL